VDLVAKVPFWQQWQRTLFDDGFGGMSWPKENGGQGADPIRKAIFT
jgi:alkylation response protein AidB-like acyl-CoA dehydrogenase